MENCPLSGLPCPHKKCIHVTEVNPDLTAQSFKSMCVQCGLVATGLPTPKMPPEVSSMFDIISNLIKEKAAVNPQPVEVKKTTKTCTGCGFTIQDIANTSRVGCGECYTCFGKDLEPFMLGYHQSLKHVGKSPKNKKTVIVEEKKPDLETIKKNLAEAIKKEDYELAAKLRDELKKLE
jgi:protein arginine kinase activator